MLSLSRIRVYGCCTIWQMTNSLLKRVGVTPDAWYVKKFGSREQAEKFFRNLTTGERL
jgi:hypothetical protein